MAHDFIKTVTTKRINYESDISGPDCIYMSVMPNGERNNSSIRLVIGARYQDACAAFIGKSGLGELIDMLTDIRDAMQD